MVDRTVFQAPADLVDIANRGSVLLEGLLDLVQLTITESRIDDGRVRACVAVLEQAHRINDAIDTILCGDAGSIESAEAYRRRMFGRIASDGMDAA